MSFEEEPIKCSFCGKKQDEVKRLVAGQGVYICDECIDTCKEIVGKQMYDYIDEDEEYELKEQELNNQIKKLNSINSEAKTINQKNQI